MRARTIAIGILLASICFGSAPAAFRNDGAVIRNSGSTNFPGYTIKVWSDGTAWSARTNRAGENLGDARSGRIPAALAQTFLNDARQARKARVVSQSCRKSASFGTSTVVTYHGWTSPDLECPGDGFVVALAADAHKIAAALNVQGLPPRRVPMPPGEHRRVPVESGQPSATPEPAAPPS